jgi:uncharacterized protein (TIGR03435 family)
MGAVAAAQDLSGTWQGTTTGDKGAKIVVKIARRGSGEHDVWTGVVYNLDSDMAYEGRGTTAMELRGGVLSFAVAPIDCRYEGRLNADGGSIAGTWTQAGQGRELTLVRATAETAWEIPKADEAMGAAADPAFEVATVKPANPNDTGDGFHLDGRQIFIENQTVEKLLLFAYGVHPKQVVDGPEWLGTERYDIKGVPDVPGQPSLKQMQAMVQKLLGDRFALTFHREKRDLPVYAVTVAKGGPKLAKSMGDPNGLMDETGSQNGGQTAWRFTNTSMADFALVMQFDTDRPVVDQTGIAGRYDFQLRWTFDETRTDANAPPGLFTAIQEQLGLKLEAVKAPTEALVVDKVERPSGN